MGPPSFESGLCRRKARDATSRAAQLKTGGKVSGAFLEPWQREGKGRDAADQRAMWSLDIANRTGESSSVCVCSRALVLQKSKSFGEWLYNPELLNPPTLSAYPLEGP